MTKSTEHLETTVKRAYACSEEWQDLSLVEAMQRLLSLALNNVGAPGIIAEDAVLIVDAVMVLPLICRKQERD